MANPSHSTLWEQYCALSSRVKFKILCFAGREATASFCIACPKGSNNAPHPEKEIARAALIVEPFTYWDWQGTRSDDEDFYKQRLLWERERGFSDIARHKLPTPKQRWDAFKTHVEKGIYEAKFVKKIAVAPWMGASDCSWIANNLPNLIALDLSVLPTPKGWGEPQDPEEGKNRPWYLPLQRLSALHPIIAFLDDSGLFKRLIKDWRTEMLENISTLAKERDYNQLEKSLTVLLERERHRVNSKGQVLSDELQEFADEVSSGKFKRIWEMFHRLKWLGIPDPRITQGEFPKNLFSQVVENCHSLEALSIRGRYEYDFNARESFRIHQHVCVFMDEIVQNIPDTLKSLELRLSVDFIDLLLKTLRRKASNVKRVGIDLGAWVQIFPYNEGNIPLDGWIRNSAEGSALRSRHDIYEEQHNKVLPKESKWYLPKYDGSEETHHPRLKDTEFFFDHSGSPVVNPHPLTKKEPEPGNPNTNELDNGESESDDSGSDGANTDDGYEIRPSPWAQAIEEASKCEHSANDHALIFKLLDPGQADTLHKMLRKLHKAQQRNRGIQLFALEAEGRTRSTDPIHPLTFIQTESLSFYATNSGVGTDYEGLQLGDCAGIYSWLAETFRWRPTFDWDWFMVTEKMIEDADPRLISKEMKENWLNHDHPETSGLNQALKTIRITFQNLKESGISIHLLIGRRQIDQSSCYWGWPFDKNKWEQWQKSKFSANLEDIAPLVDTLSALYDLRNPLDFDRLEEIERFSFQDRPDALCPGRKCPFEDPEACPFKRQHPLNHPRPQVQVAPKRSQKMANRKALRLSNTPDGYEHLAQPFAGGPPTGEHANDHPSDDSEFGEEPSDRSTLHHLARRAAFSREAFGWQRFWKQYAYSFTSLTMLRVRMPRCFDKNGTWGLAKLLMDKAGWRMATHTDERQHVQTREDLIRVTQSASGTYLRKKMQPYWPAGRFVRRTWVCRRYEHDEAIPIPTLSDAKQQFSGGKLAKNAPHYFKERDDWGNRVIEDLENLVIAEEEARELKRAKAKARKAADNERAADSSREEPQSQQSDEDLGLHGHYGQHLRNVAGQTWRSEMRNLADQLESETKNYSHKQVIKLLTTTQQSVRDRARQAVPYNTMLRRARPGEKNDRHVPPKAYRDGIAVVPNSTRDIVNEEDELRARAAAPFLPRQVDAGPDRTDQELDNDVFGDSLEDVEAPNGGVAADEGIQGASSSPPEQTKSSSQPSGGKKPDKNAKKSPFGDSSSDDSSDQAPGKGRRPPKILRRRPIIDSSTASEPATATAVPERGTRRGKLPVASPPPPELGEEVEDAESLPIPEQGDSGRNFRKRAAKTPPPAATTLPTKRARGRATKASATTTTAAAAAPSDAGPSTRKGPGRGVKRAPEGAEGDAHYWNRKAVDLKAECMRRGVNMKGKTKKEQYIAELKKLDEDEGGDDEEGGDEEED